MVKCSIDEINMTMCLDVAVDDTTYQVVHISQVGLCQIQDKLATGNRHTAERSEAGFFFRGI